MVATMKRKERTCCNTCGLRLFGDLPIDSPKDGSCNVSWPHGGRNGEGNAQFLILSLAIRFLGVLHFSICCSINWIVFPALSGWHFFSWCHIHFFMFTELTNYMAGAYWICSFITSLQRYRAHTQLDKKMIEEREKAIKDAEEKQNVLELENGVSNGVANGETVSVTDARKNLNTTNGGTDVAKADGVRKNPTSNEADVEIKDNKENENSTNIAAIEIDDTVDKDNPKKKYPLISNFSCGLVMLRELYLMQTLVVFTLYWLALFPTLGYYSDWQNCLLHGLIITLWFPELIVHSHTFTWARFWIYLSWVYVYGAWNLLGSFINGHTALYQAILPWFGKWYNPFICMGVLSGIAAVMFFFFGLVQLVKHVQAQILGEESELPSYVEAYAAQNDESVQEVLTGVVDTGTQTTASAMRTRAQLGLPSQGLMSNQQFAEDPQNQEEEETCLVTTNQQYGSTTPPAFGRGRKGSSKSDLKRQDVGQQADIKADIEKGQLTQKIQRRSMSKWTTFFISVMLIGLYLMPYFILFNAINLGSGRTHQLRLMWRNKDMLEKRLAMLERLEERRRAEEAIESSKKEGQAGTVSTSVLAEDRTTSGVRQIVKRKSLVHSGVSASKAPKIAPSHSFSVAHRQMKNGKKNTMVVAVGAAAKEFNVARDPAKEKSSGGVEDSSEDLTSRHTAAHLASVTADGTIEKDSAAEAMLDPTSPFGAAMVALDADQWLTDF